MASYRYGKQKRTETRKEEAEAGKAAARKFYPAITTRDHANAENQLDLVPGTAIPSPGGPERARRSTYAAGQSLVVYPDPPFKTGKLLLDCHPGPGPPGGPESLKIKLITTATFF